MFFVNHYFLLLTSPPVPLTMLANYILKEFLMKYYISNDTFETMDTTEEGRILFNPDTGDVHMLDFIGNTIYTLLEQRLSDDELIDTLCDMFDETRDIIASDVSAFLEDAVSKEIIRFDE